MIFKQLFSAKHEHKNPLKRLAAIAGFDPSAVEDKNMLQQLAQNDLDESVRLAALQRLNDFDLWWSAVNNDHSDKVKRRAHQYIDAVVVARDITQVSVEKLNVFLDQSASKQLLEKCVFSEVWQSQTEQLISFINKINKPAMAQKILLSTTNGELQLALLDENLDTALLEKLAKKAVNAEVKQSAEAIVIARQQKQQAQATAESNVRLVLSKILALTEQSDYLLITEAFDSLSAEYKTYQSDLDGASQHTVDEMEGKFVAISERVSALLTRLKPAYEEALAKQQAKIHQDSVLVAAEAELTQVQKVLATGAREITLGQLESHQQCLQTVSSQLKALPITQQREQLLNTLSATLQTLNKLPSFQQAIEQAQQIMSEFETQQMPDDIMQMPSVAEPLHEFKTQWKLLRKPYGELWPKELTAEYKRIIEPWQKQLNSYQSDIKGQLDKVSGLLRTIEMMIKQGRYRVAMGLNQKLERWWKRLPEHYQGKLQRQHTSVAEQVAELKDLQSYIAAPRKPALIEQMQELVTQPLAIDAQAKQIKALRSQFNALGKDETEQDMALNKTFDSVCEQAFEPCRAHYQKQQDEREANLASKQALIDSLIALDADNELAMSEVSKKLRQLQNQWRKVGHIDFEKVADVQQAYKNAVKALNVKVESYYQENKDSKSLLVTKAQKLVALESTDGVEKAKQLQSEWKTVGHAGRANEDELWQAFRLAMDAVFDKQKAESMAQREAVDEHISAITSLIESTQTAVRQSTNDVEAEQQLVSLTEQSQAHIDALPEKLQTKFIDKISKVEDLHLARRAAADKKRVADVYGKLFTVLEAWDSEQLPDDVELLPMNLQQCFKATSTGTYSRHELTLLLEIAADLPANEVDNDLRQGLQIQVMANRLQSGIELNKDELLQDWIRHGQLSSDDVSLLERIKPVFVR